MKWTVIGLALVAAGTAAVLLFYKPAPPPVVLLPEKLPVIDPNAPRMAGDPVRPETPQRYAAMPPHNRDPVVGGPSAPGSPGLTPSPVEGGTYGKGGHASAPEDGAAGDDGGKAKRFAPDKDGIRGAMKSAIPEIRECYESWLATDPKLGGKLTLAFTIAPNDAGGGSVQELSIASKDIAHLPFEGCVKNVMAGLDFGTPYDDSTGNPGPMSVKYPLVFASGDGGS